MTGPTSDAALDLLIGDGVYQSTGVPTRRFGGPGYLSVTGALYDEPESEDPPSAPDHWYVIDHPTGELAVFAETDSLSAVDASWPIDGVEHRRPVLPVPDDDVDRILGTLYRPIAQAFFEAREVSATDRAELANLLRLMLPPELRTWVYAACRDFWTWADAPATSNPPRSGT